MWRPCSLRTLTALAVLSAAAPAAAAELTRVASAADPDRPFSLDLTVRFDRTQRRATITREGLVAASGTVQDLVELRYEQTSNLVVPRIAVGLYRDLELHAELPYVLNDDHSWGYASGVSDANSSIRGNAIDASGRPCATAPCPMFPVGSGTTVYHGGRLGDLQMGVAWGVFSEARDDTKPTWVVGVDVTLPIAERYDPSTAPSHADKKNAAPVGRKIWEYDFYTALSRQFGPLDPYVKVHARFPARSGTTYSNCENATQMSSVAPANCADVSWAEEAAAKPPRVFGMLFGTEVVAYESKAEHQRAAFDLRLGADWVSEARWYNELSDATGKLLYGQRYLTLFGHLGFYLRASSFVQLKAVARFSHDRNHYLTGEPLGRDPGVLDPSVAGTREQNPNFDWRWDMPGRRFRVSDTAVFDVTGALVLNF
jgi:hypothetical protein